MKRLASVIGIAAESIEDYERLHANVWSAVLAQISTSHIVNYSIYRYADLLFSYMEYVGEDFDGDMAAMAADPTTQEWWAICKVLQHPMEDRAEGEWWKVLPEIFHLD